MKGLQNNGVLANAKHFPGHGDTDGDSHKTLPSILHTRRQLDTLDLVPFKELINQGLGSMMVAHLYVPALDSTRNTPSTLSKKIVTGLLRDDLHFKGLVFTDALNMKGISTVNKPGIVDVRAILAGNDVLLYADSIPAAIKEIKLAIAQGEITQEDIDNRCRKILQAKFWAGLNHYKPIEIKNLTSDLNPLSAQLLNRQLAEASITVLKNNQNLLPLQRLDTLHIAYVTIGDQESNSFQEQLQNYCTLSAFSVLKTTKPKQIDTLLEKLKSYNLVIVQISKTTNHPDKNFGLIPQAADLIAKICKENTTIVNLAGNPYILSRLEHITDAEAIVLSYEDTKLSGEAAASLLVGAIGANGKLPVNASADFKIGTGLEVKSLGRIKYTIPEEENIQSSDLAAIDSIALSGIRSKIYPGCQIYIAKNQKVIYNKSFGYFKYDKQHKVRNADLYDLASITKIAASTLAMMKLVQEGKVKLDDSLAVYLPELTGTNKQGLILRNVLTHQAGLKPWIAFEQDTHLKDKVTHKIKYIPGVFAKEASDEYPSRVAEHLYVHQGYDTVIYNKINKSELKGAGKFIYSDLGYYYLKKIIEKQTGMSLADYVDKNFYKPMGLSTMGYLPRNHFSVDQIAPTELDLTFRNQQLQGDVHDQGAALLGGIAGHAGLFSNASDLGVLMQMYLQKGEYAGKRYLDTAVVSEFTRCQFCKSNHRALGFDKPDLDNPKQNPVCDCVSYLSFGHSGFTGTLTWVDPAKQLVYVFLSNRVYPKAEPNKLAKSGIRTKIQQVIYNAIH